MGFDCGDGKLALRSGFWANFSEASAFIGGGFGGNRTLLAFRCQYEAACIGNTGDEDMNNSSDAWGRCAPGYTGVSCGSCQSDFAGLLGYCTRCFGAGLSVAGITLIIALVITSVTLVTTLYLEETVGASKVPMRLLSDEVDCVLSHRGGCPPRLTCRLP